MAKRRKKARERERKATQFYPHFFLIIIALEMIKGKVEEDEEG